MSIMEIFRFIFVAFMTLAICNGTVTSKTTMNNTQPIDLGSLPLGMLTNGVIQTLGKGVLSNLVSAFPRVMTDTGITKGCLNDTVTLLGDIFQFKTYALQFLDADGKLPPGVFQGGKYWVGEMPFYSV